MTFGPWGASDDGGLGYEFAIQPGEKKLPDDALRYYFCPFSDPYVLRGSFGLYRAWGRHPRTERAARDPGAHDARPAIGGADSWGGDRVGNIAADEVQTVVISGVGHWIAEPVSRRFRRP